MQTEKITRNAKGEMTAAVLFGQPIRDIRVAGYEIHIGHAEYEKGAKHFAILSSESDPSQSSRDGCISADTRVFGTYLHGIFDEDSFRHQFLCAARGFRKLSRSVKMNPWKHLREDSLNRLAREMESALDGWACPIRRRFRQMPTLSSNLTVRDDEQSKRSPNSLFV